MSDKTKMRYKAALNNARTLEYQLAMLCGYVDDPDASREAISWLQFSHKKGGRKRGRNMVK